MVHQWTVGDVMTRDVERVSEETPYRSIVDLLTRRGISAAPVVDGSGRVVGVVSEADLLHRIEFVGEEHERRVIERRAGLVPASATRTYAERGRHAAPRPA